MGKQGEKGRDIDRNLGGLFRTPLIASCETKIYSLDGFVAVCIYNMGVSDWGWCFCRHVTLGQIAKYLIMLVFFYFNFMLSCTHETKSLKYLFSLY